MRERERERERKWHFERDFVESSQTYSSAQKSEGGEGKYLERLQLHKSKVEAKSQEKRVRVTKEENDWEEACYAQMVVKRAKARETRPR